MIAGGHDKICNDSTRLEIAPADSEDGAEEDHLCMRPCAAHSLRGVARRGAKESAHRDSCPSRTNRPAQLI